MPLPPANSTSPTMSSATVVGLLRTAAINRSCRRRDPYAIERFPSVNGAILLVGYDGRGEVMLELRIPATKYSERTVDKMRRWLKVNDEAPPPLGIVR